MTEKFIRIFKSLLPAPFTIAVLLTFFVFIWALIGTFPEGESVGNYTLTLFEYWEQGVWGEPYMVFTLQMMLMLVLGHVLALSKPVHKLIQYSVQFCTNTPKAALFVTLLTVFVSLFNWGLGLIFGAIMARKVGEYALQKGININYPIIGAAGYSGLMVWHGGISGSAPIKVADKGSIHSLVEGGSLSEAQIASLPDSIPFSETIGSSMNISISLALLIILPFSMYMLAKYLPVSLPNIRRTAWDDEKPAKIEGAEKLDHSFFLSLIFGGFIIFYCIYKAFIKPDDITTDFITPNYINLLLLGLCVFLHGSIFNFLNAIDKAIGGAAGIIIQFPLYFGILGIMKYSGLMATISDFFVAISTTVTYPIYTFFSAGLINIFVPSGGGQWAVQGPIIVQSANEMGVPLSKSIMALAYGDQLTNMLQPFWALPLLAITGLKAKEIIPYTLYLMLIGIVIFISGLLIF